MGGEQESLGLCSGGPEEALGPEDTLSCHPGACVHGLPHSDSVPEGSHSKAPDTTPHFKDMEVPQSQSWGGSSQHREDLGRG